MCRLVGVVFALLFAWVSAGAGSAGGDARDRVLVLGDSLSAGYGIAAETSWPVLLGQRLDAAGYRHSVVNASISGETTAGGKRRIDALLEDHAPVAVVVALGANDGLRGFDPAVTRANLVAILDAVSASGASAVLPQVRIPPNYGPAYTEAFERVYDELGARDDVIAAPFMLERFAIRRDAFQADGLHPVAAVQGDIVDTLWPAIDAALAAGATAALLR